MPEIDGLQSNGEEDSDNDESTTTINNLQEQQHQCEQMNKSETHQTFLPDDFPSLEQFVLEVPKDDGTVNCRITRRCQGIEGRLFPTYYFHLELENDKKVCT